MKRLFVCENCGKIFMQRTDGTVRAVFGYDMCSDQCANEFMNRKKGKQEMSENYIVINGKKVELTDEQMKALGIAHKRKNPFERVEPGDDYYYISSHNDVGTYTHSSAGVDNGFYAVSNYFNDEAFANQVALHQLLYRKLLKYAYENECEDVEWNSKHAHWLIYYNANNGKFYVGGNDAFKYQSVYFSTRRSAECAIEEVVEPFIKEHPEFKW